MIRVWVKIIIYFVVFVLLQALVMNNIHLFDIITPFVYLYVILKLPVNLSRSQSVIISFLLGLVIDIFSDTYGMHAAACTLTGFICKPLIDRFVDIKDMPEDSIPSFNVFGTGKFIRYILILVAIHHITLFIIDSFSFFQPLLLITRILSSILATSVLIFIIEAFNISKVRSGE